MCTDNFMELLTFALFYVQWLFNSQQLITYSNQSIAFITTFSSHALNAMRCVVGDFCVFFSRCCCWRFTLLLRIHERVVLVLSDYLSSVFHVWFTIFVCRCDRICKSTGEIYCVAWTSTCIQTHSLITIQFVLCFRMNTPVGHGINH